MTDDQFVRLYPNAAHNAKGIIAPMIPLRLRISGFLSYRDPVDLDFTSFELACISGPNGAGKSSLLDAITWVLFGQARKRDDSLINLQSPAAEVVLTFRYEGAEYRVQRSVARGKTAVLEFQVRQPALIALVPASGPVISSAEDAAWKPLTERTLRETQSRIEQILRLDYETFINAAFFLQGKADQFAQQNAAKRKEVLGNILGMEIWESYKSRAADIRRDLEAELASVEGRLAEIAAEFAEEIPRRQRLAQLEAELARLSSSRKSQATALDNLRKSQAALEKQRALIAQLDDSLAQSRLRLTAGRDRLAARQAVHAESAELAGRSAEIQSAYAAWKAAVQELERWEEIASAFRDREKDRLPPLQEVATERARIEEEKRHLLFQQEQSKERTTQLQTVEAGLQEARTLLEAADARLVERVNLLKEQGFAREEIARLKAENEILKTEMDQLRSRIETLQSASGATCPLCGQPLSEAHRASTLESLQSEGKARGDRFRSNKAAADQLQAELTTLETRLDEYAAAEDDILARSQTVAQLSERFDALHALNRDWESSGKGRLARLNDVLAKGDYAPEARSKLAKVDEELARLGYDAAAHDRARTVELAGRSADEEHRRLMAAEAALVPIEDEIRGLESEIADRTSEIATRESEVERLKLDLRRAEAEMPDITGAERLLFELQEQENVLNQQVGAARQKVTVLEDLRIRDAELTSARQSLAIKIGRYKVLERAFGKDGVPALLIEQALPEIESRANEILDRLSDGRMSVRFLTQAGYKDRKREDLKETLDIKISDGVGPRDYELYSGGEAFRVNFAIRLALSQVLAARKGARLQTLVIDEGFASQDADGRQRLIEAINLVKNDFGKILLITHLEELKDAFPTRIEVEKTDRGSSIRVS